jgi:hypothetical protein
MRRTPSQFTYSALATYSVFITQRMPEVKSRRELYSQATRAALLDEAAALFAGRLPQTTHLASIPITPSVLEAAGWACLSPVSEMTNCRQLAPAARWLSVTHPTRALSAC